MFADAKDSAPPPTSTAMNTEIERILRELERAEDGRPDLLLRGARWSDMRTLATEISRLRREMRELTSTMQTPPTGVV